MAQSVLIRVAAVCSLVVLGANVGAQSLPQVRNSSISVQGDIAGLAKLVGRGTGVGLEKSAYDNAGNEIVWRETRRVTDSRGGVHVSYKQHLVGTGFEAELVGSDIAVHYAADGNVDYVSGHQFESVKLGNRPVLDRRTANLRAERHLRSFSRRGDDAPFAAELSTRPVALKLVNVGDEFRFAYFAIATDTAGEEHAVILDAQTDRVLARSIAHPGANCSPTTPITPVTSVAYPVRYPTVPARTGVKANKLTTPRAGGETHEAAWNYSSTPIGIYQRLSSDLTNPLVPYKCDPNTTTSYSLIPLATNTSGTPLYENRPLPNNNGNWEGRAAGDAMWHTYQTLRTFSGFGRKGWDDANSEAAVVLNITGGYDGARFSYQENTAYPSNSVQIKPASAYHHTAAALDVIAHEFGHGVVFTSAGYQYIDAVDKQLHEGWADVIGMAVEKRRQPAGWGVEQSSDWTMHEDMSLDPSYYDRGAINDNGYHVWKGPNTGTTPPKRNDKLHRDDNIMNSTTPVAFSTHSYGNMLNVVHMLMSDGGQNPVCSSLPNGTLGCDRTVTGVGSRASAILFQSLHLQYVRSTHKWAQLAAEVQRAAFDQYNLCTYDGLWNAAPEQQAVLDAFAAIGYPAPSEALIKCPGMP